MNFDVISMKQRAKDLMKSTKPTPILLGLIILIFNCIMFGGLIYIISCLENAVNDSADVMSNYLLVLVVFYLNIILNTFFMTSLSWFCMKVTREESMVFSDIFIAFKEKQGKAFIIAIVKSLCLCIGYMCCVVGILFPVYWFRFAENIVKDDNTMNPIKAMSKSMKLMKGHYLELIKIDISFIGWWILHIFTLGIAGIYVLPYTSIVYAEFYDYIKSQYEAFNA